MQAAVEQVVARYGRVDVLVNVVGIGGARGTAVSTDMGEWAKGMEVNVGSMVDHGEVLYPRHAAERHGARVQGRDCEHGQCGGVARGDAAFAVSDE